ncbi:hypothetical protein P152DRAFT_470425 [Eremomyces bilateralis CBS 781.70]|uniref:BTB domain-containing protein n=1 Tax=Eremomyces bilateralis CBS 781.70 TaxID=1392243 RepID=A0A6G1GEB5_9PEZI|nr:uncharacterized protein P152DRAFT_470425 [Eremomyces bilateralis CBS 781.70]KAF1816398.1 hypothetical protein P152DRAFT_470425 [Eremomyces bilateralis CBS 781.70]
MSSSGPEEAHRLPFTVFAKSPASRFASDLLSPYFAATFGGDFRETHEQSTTLAEIDGVVSVRSFEMLLQWLYVGRVSLGTLPAQDAISSLVEFLRLADHCSVTGMEGRVVDRIKTLLNSSNITIYSRRPNPTRGPNPTRNSSRPSTSVPPQSYRNPIHYDGCSPQQWLEDIFNMTTTSFVKKLKNFTTCPSNFSTP